MKEAGSELGAMSVSVPSYSRDVSMGITSVRLPSTTSHRKQAAGRFRGGHSDGPARRFSAPSGLTDSDSNSDSANKPSFSVQAPTGLTDSDTDGDSDGEVTSAPAQRQAAKIAPPSAVELAISDLQARMQREMLISAEKGVAIFRRKWEAIERQGQEDQKRVEAFMRERRAAVAREEAERQAAIAARQGALMAGLQQEHTSEAEQMERQAQVSLRKAEEERQRAAQAEQRKAAEEAARKREEEQRKREAAEQQERAVRAAEEQKAAQQRQAEAEREAQAHADAERRARGATASTPSPGPGSSPGPGFVISDSAAAFERSCAEALQAAEEASRQLDANPASSKEKRAVTRSIAKSMNSIGGTQEQVDVKSQQIVQLLGSLPPLLKQFAMRKLAQAFIDLSEGVKTQFPGAEVAVAVCHKHPDFAPVLLATLHKACPLAVPKCVLRGAGEPTDDYLRRWGFQRAATLDPMTKQPREGWEDADVFLERLSAHVRFLAAFIQSDGQSGVDSGWSYLSRLINVLPPNRYTAFALVAFVEIAGYKLYMTYRRQFSKLVALLDRSFVEEIIRRGMEDAISAVRRLREYMRSREFEREPAGRRLEMYDASSYERA